MKKTFTFFTRNQKYIEKTIRKLGLNDLLSNCSIGGIDKIVKYRRHVIVWFSNPTDYGFNLFRSNDPQELEKFIVEVIGINADESFEFLCLAD
jgi:hypothetical protein